MLFRSRAQLLPLASLPHKSIIVFLNLPNVLVLHWQTHLIEMVVKLRIIINLVEAHLALEVGLQVSPVLREPFQVSIHDFLVEDAFRSWLIINERTFSNKVVFAC